ncbi:hypothetical protein GJ699_26830 [Duganella sp. FT80W]|uniref:MipA/OmpV family protein n=2 Tax=Duganella guangzhouensis TaxID=2666084 RepID=A0A6I2L714_9BURK|nr:hypothetical protein [Duganella guangzhouensis]
MAPAAALHAQQSADTGWRIDGDIGAGVNATPTAAHARGNGTTAIPYLNFDAGPLFARIDTFGVKLAPAGAGSIELLTRVLSDGYTPASAAAGGHRRDSLPLGLGTLQVTSFGALMANVYHDVGKSGGNLADLMYGAELPAGELTLYPQLGAEYRSSAYVRYYDGVSGHAATNPYAALFAECHLGGSWYLNANLRRTWLDRTIRSSPLVRRATLDANLVAVSYRFK